MYEDNVIFLLHRHHISLQLPPLWDREATNRGESDMTTWEPSCAGMYCDDAGNGDVEEDQGGDGQ